MKVQILGTGYSRCKMLLASVERAVQELGLRAEIEKATEIQDITKFQILVTPGLAIDGTVKSAGCVPSADEIKTMFQEARAKRCTPNVQSWLCESAPASVQAC